MTLEKVLKEPEATVEVKGEPEDSHDKLTSSKLAQKLNLKTAELMQTLYEKRFLEDRGGKAYLTAKGREAGGEFRLSPRFGPYFIWPTTLELRGIGA